MRGVTEAKLSCMLEDALRSELLVWKPLALNHDDEHGEQTAMQVYETSLCWLLELNCKLRCYPECFCLAASLLDRFLSCVKVQPRHLNCAAVACFVLAIKVTEEDTEVPQIDYIVKMMLTISQGISKLSVSEVVRMEAIVLDKLSWNINPVTALHFLQIFHAMATGQTAQQPTPRAAAAAGDRHNGSRQWLGSPSRQLATVSAKLMRFMCSADACTLKPSIVALSLLSLELTATTPTPAPTSPADQPSHCWLSVAARQLCTAVGAPPDELERGLDLVAAALYWQRRPPTDAAGGGCGKQCKRKCLQLGDGEGICAADDLQSGAVGRRDTVTEQLKDEP